MSERIPNWLEKRAELSPDRVALSANDEQWTFTELNRRAKITARKIAALGIEKGDFVSFLFQNGLHAAETVHALHYLGAVLVPLNTRLTPRELAWQLNDSGAKLLLYDEANNENAKTVMREALGIQAVSVQELSSVHEVDIPLQTVIELDDLHSILYTSGTTGYPKGVMLSYGSHWWSAIGSSLNLGLHQDDRWLAAVPLFHVSGLSILMRSVIYGITAVIHEKFEPKATNHAIQNEKVTIVSVVSSMLSRMVEVLDVPYPKTFRCMLLGGGPAPKVLLEKCRSLDIPVFQTYGMTETASQIVTLAPEYMLSKLGSAGKPLFPAELYIEKDGQQAKAGETGEVAVRGPNVTKGYFKREDATKSAIHEDGWLRTGDLGYLDEDGFLYVLDRRKDLIISGGENVYPAEIEAVLLEHPNVGDAGVSGVSDEQWGQVPVAFVQRKKGSEIDGSTMIAFCRERLARYKVPARVYFVEELPRNASRKLLRRELIRLLPK
jgi:O-succinylbenzoic acid--CoA ligase